MYMYIFQFSNDLKWSEVEIIYTADSKFIDIIIMYKIKLQIFLVLKFCPLKNYGPRPINFDKILTRAMFCIIK